MNRCATPTCLFVVVLLAGPSSACRDEDHLRGTAGESCTSRNDCEEGLRCIAQVCTATGEPSDSAADAGTEPGSGGEGALCAARRDCQVGLMCLDNRCRLAMLGGEVGDARYSGRGESCQAKNDCTPDLACVQQICREQSLSLEPTSKQCVRVECEDAADCCEGFTPNDNCEQYRENCELDPVFCNTYRSLCECNEDCVDSLCVASMPGCDSNDECTSAQTPFCVEGTCRQCERDENCPGAGSQCIRGLCMAPCSVDENCPALFSCRDGECVDTGCQSDRECVFLLDDSRALCQDGDCLVPCEHDSDCGAGESTFEICEAGQCRFVGCDTDAECRAALGLSSELGDTRALCR